MPRARAGDGTQLHYEEVGEGTPIVFVHEFAGDWRSWEPQVRQFARSHRCITFSARGYPPSDVPDAPERYGQEIARDDVLAVMDAAGVAQAHVVGHSMGAYTALHVGLDAPERCLSLVAAGCGWGSDPEDRAEKLEMARATGRMFLERPIAEAAAHYADLPMRHPHKAKDPRGWREFARMLEEHDGIGSGLTMLNLQVTRPTLPDLQDRLTGLDLPLLVLVGDHDAACLHGSLLLFRTAPQAALQVLPRTGHTLITEEPCAVNAALATTFAAVEAGRWQAHVPGPMDHERT
jgi:pimeloyl-ACP methyl ester carboxylesterase